MTKNQYFRFSTIARLVVCRHSEECIRCIVSCSLWSYYFCSISNRISKGFLETVCIDTSSRVRGESGRIDRLRCSRERNTSARAGFAIVESESTSSHTTPARECIDACIHDATTSESQVKTCSECLYGNNHIWRVCDRRWIYSSNIH